MEERIKTGIPGFDELLGEGIEKGSVVLVAGGAGTGKTNFCCQCLFYGPIDAEKVLYISFEEDPQQIKRHAAKFGMDFDRLEKDGKARFIKVDVYQMARALEAILLKAKGGMMVKEGLPKILPDDFKPDRIVVDSLSTMTSVLKEGEYRYFIFQLFSEFKRTGATTFAVGETAQDPSEYSRTGIEEFLADGVIVLYNIKRAGMRVRALEVLKLRGTSHEERIVPFKITGKGIVVYPKQELFTE